MRKILLLIMILSLTGCDFFSDAKKYKALYESANQQITQLKSELANANITIEKLKAELERSRTLHKKMLE